MDEEQEIRRIQMERAKMDGRLVSLSGLEYDTDFYGSSKLTGNFDSSIAVDEDEEESEANEALMRKFTTNTTKTFLNSFSGPSSLLNDTREDKDDFDPFKDFKRKTIADREDEYKSQWRKRKLSPPQVDPFNKNKSNQNLSEVRTYKEIMQDVQLEKERKEVLIKIAKKKREEEEEKERQKLKRKQEEEEARKREKKLKKDKKHGRHDEDARRSKSPSRSPEKPATRDEWVIDIVKKGEKMSSLHLDPDTTYAIGRESGSDIRLEHESCSKKHAKLTFMNGRPNLMDLSSTNGTKLNGQEMVPGEWYKLSEGDSLEFGCSSRQYIVKYT